MESFSRSLVDSLLVTEEQSPDSDEDNTYTSVGFIIWYVFLVLCCGIPTMVCMIACAVCRCKKQDEEQQMIQEEVDAEIARIEANIRAYRTHEKHGHKQLLVRVLESSRMTLAAENFERNFEPDAETPSDPLKINVAAEVAKGCSICLNKYAVGDEVTTSPGCGHMFHLDCLMDWFLSDGRKKQQATSSAHLDGGREVVPVYLCPCCRQPFVEIVALTPSTTPPPNYEFVDQNSISNTARSVSLESSCTRATELSSITHAVVKDGRQPRCLVPPEKAPWSYGSVESDPASRVDTGVEKLALSAEGEKGLGKEDQIQTPARHQPDTIEVPLSPTSEEEHRE